MTYEEKLLLLRFEQQVRKAAEELEGRQRRNGKWRGKHCFCPIQPCTRHCPKQTAPCDCTWWQQFPKDEELVAVETAEGLVDPLDGIPVKPDPEQRLAPKPPRVLDKTEQPPAHLCPHGLKNRLYCSLCVRQDAPALAKRRQQQSLEEQLNTLLEALGQ